MCTVSFLVRGHPQKTSTQRVWADRVCRKWTCEDIGAGVRH